MWSIRAMIVLVPVLAVSISAYAEEVQIIRDTYGVPFIQAETAAGAAFGVGYAQAEDRLDDLYRNVRTAIGRMAEAFGEEHLGTDYAMHLVENARRCEEYYPQVPEELRSLLEAYVAGVRAYEAEHPEKRPEFALDLQPWHAMAIGRAMVLRWPLDVLMDDLKAAAPESPNYGSNGFAIAPKRSAEQCAMVLTDPHQAWNGIALFWEGRVHGGNLNMNGFFLVGSPIVGLGHSEHVAWAMTSGGPDTADVYQLKLNPEMPMQYEYDGEWKEAELRLYSIKVKGEEKARDMPALYTMHGPLLGEPDFDTHTAFAGKTPYMEDMGVTEQLYAMVLAKDAGEFYEAISRNHLMHQNIIYGDRKGNIGYVRVGRTPKRPEGHDWTRPVPGWTSETAWGELHPIQDHVQLLNPEQGYIQNCNVSPRFMYRNSPLTSAKYPAWLYNEAWDKNNTRGMRSIELLDADKSITKEEAMAIAMDVVCPLSKNWVSELVRASNEHGAEYMQKPRFADALYSLMEWPWEFSQDKREAVFMWKFREHAAGKIDSDKISKGGELEDEEQLKLLQIFDEAMEAIAAQYDFQTVTWGQIHKIGRSGQLFPLDGAIFGKGDSKTETLRAVECEESPKGSGVRVANSGSLAAMLMLLREDGIESYSCAQWGQSADPESPHHVDQARELYSKRQFKPAWNTLEAVKAVATSEKTLQFP